MWDLRIRILLELLLTQSHSLGQVALGLPDFCRGEHPTSPPGIWNWCFQSMLGERSQEDEGWGLGVQGRVLSC